MKFSDDRDELERRERELREREIQIRLRELESEIKAKDIPLHQTIKDKTEKKQKHWMKKVILGGKLLLIGVATIVAVKVAKIILGIIILTLLVWLSYKLLSNSKKQISQSQERFETSPEKAPKFKQQESQDSPDQKKTQKDEKNFSSDYSNVNSTIPRSPSNFNLKDLENKFHSWDIEEEIVRMKAEMQAPNFKTNKQQTNTQSYNQEKQGKNENINCAYATLGLHPTASLIEVKQAYRACVKKWHPDLFIDQPQLQQQAHKKLQTFNEAYTILCSKNS